MKTALIHDWLVAQGGAEKVLGSIAEILPGDLYTLVMDQSKIDQFPFSDQLIKTSFIQKLPRAKKKYRSYLPLFPLAIEQFDLSDYDLVVSSSHSIAKGVLTHSEQFHICYCHTPMRYAWDLYHQYLREAKLKSGIKGGFAKLFLHYLRMWDAQASLRVNTFIANSKYIAKRIEKLYKQKAHVIYPPVDVETYSLEANKDDYYFTASRLVPYKKIDLIVEAFSKMPDKRLVVAGDGPDLKKIKQKAGKNVEILGQVTQTELKNLMQKAKAFVFAAMEDFGITPLEAQACGTPVIAYGRGGAVETVQDGETGLFFENQSVGSIISAINKFEGRVNLFDPIAIRRNAEKFSEKRFQKEFMSYVQRKYEEFKG